MNNLRARVRVHGFYNVDLYYCEIIYIHYVILYVYILEISEFGALLAIVWKLWQEVFAYQNSLCLSYIGIYYTLYSPSLSLFIWAIPNVYILHTCYTLMVQRVGGMTVYVYSSTSLCEMVHVSSRLLKNFWSCFGVVQMYWSSLFICLYTILGIYVLDVYIFIEMISKC